jgi:hypothetical protein
MHMGFVRSNALACFLVSLKEESWAEDVEPEEVWAYRPSAGRVRESSGPTSSAGDGEPTPNQPLPNLLPPLINRQSLITTRRPQIRGRAVG